MPREFFPLKRNSPGLLPSTVMGFGSGKADHTKRCMYKTIFSIFGAGILGVNSIFFIVYKV